MTPIKIVARLDARALNELADALEAEARRLRRRVLFLQSIQRPRKPPPLAPWERRRVELRKRNIRIARLARQGLTDAEIAARVGLHPKSVNRILGQQLRRP